MRRINILKAREAKTKRFLLYSFTQSEEYLSSMQLLERLRERSSRKEIRKLAKKHQLPTDEEKILFAKKIIKIMLDETRDGK
ncbi:MAG: hypothetical protein U9R27_00460 [Campylobacterota bacterium]|nr:hypothetical protein [Campylobacterota bacterium]